MNEKPSLKICLVIAGVLLLFYLGYGLARPVKLKARAQHITAINAAPHVTVSFILSNTLPQSIGYQSR